MYEMDQFEALATLIAASLGESDVKVNHDHRKLADAENLLSIERMIDLSRIAECTHN